MRHRIYNIRKHLTTVIISVSIGLLMGGGGAYAAGLISGQQIKAGTISEGKLDRATRENIQLGVGAMRGDVPLQSLWEEDITRMRESLTEQIEEEYVHK